MTVRVQAITVGAETVTALVTATSRECFRGQPVARIQVGLTLPTVQAESSFDTRQRVRDEALRFVDVA